MVGAIEATVRTLSGSDHSKARFETAPRGAYLIRVSSRRWLSGPPPSRAASARRNRAADDGQKSFRGLGGCRLVVAVDMDVDSGQEC